MISINRIIMVEINPVFCRGERIHTGSTITPIDGDCSGMRLHLKLEKRVKVSVGILEHGDRRIEVYSPYANQLVVYKILACTRKPVFDNNKPVSCSRVKCKWHTIRLRLQVM